MRRTSEPRWQIMPRSLLRQLRYPRGDGQILHHTSQDQGADGRHYDAAAVGAGIVGVLAGGFPLVGVEVVGEADVGGFGRLAVVGDTLEAVRSGGAAGKENSVIAAGTPAGDGETRGAGVRGQLAPFNLGWILSFDLAQPALVGRHVTRS